MENLTPSFCWPFSFIAFGVGVIVHETHNEDVFMTKIALGLLVALAYATSAQASYTVLNESDRDAREAANYDGGLYGTGNNALAPTLPVEPKVELPPISSVDVTAFNVAGISLGMELDAALEAANKQAQRRDIAAVRTQSRNGKVASLTWGNVNEETIVNLIEGTGDTPEISRVKSIRYSFNNPEALVAGALEKYGEPSVRDLNKGKLTWCSAERDIKSQCDMKKPWMTIDTYTVSTIGILDITDPTLVKAPVTVGVAKPIKEVTAEDEGYTGPLPGL
ncbi:MULTISPECIES: hypothetical protein [Morganellaceae]|uniref:Uncharacterized protein n=1 Tax=Moellerella wisconsensis TaxID=158849 RepID=A0A9Q8V5T1_9GAMM|nr:MULTISPECIES: hypothetical protein [Morganellaceae]ELR5072030.1 hypothetical protein [Providencia rettgeri]ELR5204358.1 hypothetical protein [Providencia rettgeri]MDV5235710.1 hypothetical protein [Providencia rettgeri]UNH29166.1 hypothetical protein MNY64_16645 [Moellerella wisconsensis]UNH32552.1 hypothetical protein MNY72_16060 [Moellerella wisconsensis]